MKDNGEDLKRKYSFLSPKKYIIYNQKLSFGKLFALGIVAGFFVGGIASIVFPDFLIPLFGSNINCGWTPFAGHACGATFQGVTMIAAIIVGATLGLLVGLVLKLLKKI